MRVRALISLEFSVHVEKVWIVRPLGLSWIALGKIAQSAAEAHGSRTHPGRE